MIKWILDKIAEWSIERMNKENRLCCDWCDCVGATILIERDE